MTQEKSEAEKMYEEVLAKEMKQREEREKQRMGGGSKGGGKFEVIKWMGLEDKVEKVCRIYGNPIVARKVGTDPKIFFHSKIVNDKKDGYVNIIWKQDTTGFLDEDWILNQLFSYVFTKKYVKYPDGHKNEKGYDGEYQYTYKDTEIYKRLDINLKKDVSIKFFPPKAKAKTRVAMNVIDRHDNWCSENNHSKILTSKLSYWKDDQNGNPIYFPDMGIPEMTYNNIIDNVFSPRRRLDLDIVIQKDAKNKSYIVRDILEEKISAGSKAIGNADPFTDVEKSFELYDFDTMKTFTTTSYSALYKRLVGLFKLADAEFGTDFTERLEKLVIEEQNTANEEEKKSLEEDFEEEISQDETKTVIEEKPVEVVQEPTRRQPIEVKEEAKSKSDFEFNFPSWNSLSPVEKKNMIENISGFNDTVPIYKDPKDAMPCVDKNCKFLNTDTPTAYPSTVVTCPICGKKDTNVEEVKK